mgnify:CR=1 FL=1
MQRNTYDGCLVSLDDAAPPVHPGSLVSALHSGGGLLPESRHLVLGARLVHWYNQIEYASNITHVEIHGIDDGTSVHWPNPNISYDWVDIEHITRVYK